MLLMSRLGEPEVPKQMSGGLLKGKAQEHELVLGNPFIMAGAELEFGDKQLQRARL